MKLTQILNEVKIVHKKDLFLKVYGEAGIEVLHILVSYTPNLEEAIKEYEDNFGEDISEELKSIFSAFCGVFKKDELWMARGEAGSFEGDADLSQSYKYISWNSEEGRHGDIWVMLSNEKFF